MKLSGWGRYPVIDAQVHVPRSVETLRELVTSEATVIARGNGRAYGDSAINPSATIEMRHLNRMLAFNSDTGQLTAEAGVILGDVITAFLPCGWFPAVTPGTKYVTLGGMIAADVHGKNHHKEGSFREFVDWIDVMGPDGEIKRCSHDKHVDLFKYTLGGMGLTGIILSAAIRLRPVETGWIRQTTIPAPNLKAAIAAFEQAQDTTYSVAWIDCLGTGKNLGRSLVMLGEHAGVADLPSKYMRQPLQIPTKHKLSIPLDFPSVMLNQFTVRAFNALYYWSGTRRLGTQLVGWDSYFYPLDAILGWNRIYGRKGFVQFQCALPLDRSEEGLIALLEIISEVGAGSFLAVLKRFGSQESCFSFPMEGYTLALDFPVNPKTFALLDTLNRITINHGGRFNLTKDSRITAETLRLADGRTEHFKQIRDKAGWSHRFRSSQSERLLI
jgi:decaprenylphospho-beta-D-ribofuranose 2-oxidase